MVEVDLFDIYKIFESKIGIRYANLKQDIQKILHDNTETPHVLRDNTELRQLSIEFYNGQSIILDYHEYNNLDREIINVEFKG